VESVLVVGWTATGRRHPVEDEGVRRDDDTAIDGAIRLTNRKVVSFYRSLASSPKKAVLAQFRILAGQM
jgi:hypothetical protein